MTSSDQNPQKQNIESAGPGADNNTTLANGESDMTLVEGAPVLRTSGANDDKTLVESTAVIGNNAAADPSVVKSMPVKDKVNAPDGLTTRTDSLPTIDTVAPNAAAVQPGAAGGEKDKKAGGGPIGLAREVAELIVVTLFLLIAIRWALAEARYIPSSSMEPTLQIEDRLLVEKVSGHLGKPIRRGDILVFYPPPSEMPNGKDLSNEPMTVLGRLTGLPFLPYEPAFIKRVIALPGDKIRVQRGVGVFINEQLLDEPYVKEHPNYDLNVMGDIGGRTNNGYLRPFNDSKEPIIVPAGKLFMMGDNRNNSEDSHVWGFLDEKRVIGRACLLFWRWLEPPKYPRSIDTD
jgi:signal peptidase I